MMKLFLDSNQVYIKKIYKYKEKRFLHSNLYGTEQKKTVPFRTKNYIKNLN